MRLCTGQNREEGCRKDKILFLYSLLENSSHNPFKIPIFKILQIQNTVLACLRVCRETKQTTRSISRRTLDSSLHRMHTRKNSPIKHQFDFRSCRSGGS